MNNLPLINTCVLLMKLQLVLTLAHLLKFKKQLLDLNKHQIILLLENCGLSKNKKQICDT